MPPLLVWVYNSTTGALLQMPYPMALAELKAGLGWHGPFDTRDQAVDFYNKGKGANPGWKAPTGNPLTATGNLIASGGEAAKQAIVGDPFKGLNLVGWVVRIAEIALGVVLIGVGIAKLTGTTNAVSNIIKSKVPL